MKKPRVIDDEYRNGFAVMVVVLRLVFFFFLFFFSSSLPYLLHVSSLSCGWFCLVPFTLRFFVFISDFMLENS